MEIIIGQGIGEIRFGQTEAQAIELLGEPDKSYDSEFSKRLQYFDLQIELSFVKEELEDRLGLIDFRHPDVLLFNRKLIGESAETVLPFIADNISDEPEYDDYCYLETYLYESHWLELHFELNLLRSINIGVLWLDNDTPQWP